MQTVLGHFELDDDPARVPFDVVWEWLSTQAYWGRWRRPDDARAQLDGAWRVVAAYRRGTGELVGFCRAVSDGVALAYLADLFVIDSERGQGLGTALSRVMIEDGPGSGFRWLLHTSDAHEMYRKLGFAPPNASLMERPGHWQQSVVSPGESGQDA